MKSKLPLGDVLYSIRNSYGNPFKIVFVRSNGAKVGSLKSVVCLYGGKTSRPSFKKSKRNWMHKEFDTIPLVEYNTKKPISPLISHIVEYNNQIVSH